VLRTLQQSARRLALARTNRRRLSSALNSLAATNRIPIFFIFTPDLVHIAPFCIPNEVATVQPIILLNGVSESDSVWIRNVHTDIPTVSLKTSLSRNAKSMEQILERLGFRILNVKIYRHTVFPPVTLRAIARESVKRIIGQPSRLSDLFPREPNRDMFILAQRT